MVDVNYGGWTYCWANGVLHQMLCGWNPPGNGQDKTVQLGSYCSSSTSVATTEEDNPAIVYVFFYV